jgi:hypothetical protein
MNCEELRPDYLLYAIGAMDEPESSEMRSHLVRGCETCTEGLRQAHALAYSMGAVLDGPDLPRQLRSRVLAISGAASEKDLLRSGIGIEDRRMEAAGIERNLRDRPVLVANRPPVWARPIAAWQGLAFAAACLVLALTPGLLWRGQLTEWRARQAADGALLEREKRAEASLRDQVARLEGESALQAVPIFALELERGSRSLGEAIQQIAIPPGAAAVVLALPADVFHQASTAELRSASDQTIWTLSPLPPSDSESAGLTIAARLLAPGRYSVVLRAGERALAHLPFQVISR